VDPRLVLRDYEYGGEMFSLSHPIQNALGGRDEVGVVTFFSARKTILLVPRVRAQCAKNEVWQDAVSRKRY
jgi:hypothetical protein